MPESLSAQRDVTAVSVITLIVILVSACARLPEVEQTDSHAQEAVRLHEPTARSVESPRLKSDSAQSNFVQLFQDVCINTAVAADQMVKLAHERNWARIPDAMIAPNPKRVEPNHRATFVISEAPTVLLKIGYGGIVSPEASKMHSMGLAAESLPIDRNRPLPDILGSGRIPKDAIGRSECRISGDTDSIDEILEIAESIQTGDSVLGEPDWDYSKHATFGNLQARPFGFAWTRYQGGIVNIMYGVEKGSGVRSVELSLSKFVLRSDEAISYSLP